MPTLARATSHGVTLLGDAARPGGVTLAFTERTGGVSAGCFHSLNLGSEVGDDPAAVAENRRRALAALGLEHLDGRLVCPKQVHGDTVVTVAPGHDAPDVAQARAREGADAIVCAVPDVPVLLCSADCALVVLAAPGAFAVAHSGWRGTIARISAKALATLVEVAGCAPADVCAYVGPHIGADDYEVSAQLVAQFAAEFGAEVVVGERNLDLGRAIELTLVEAGVPAGQVVRASDSTASSTDRYFSYRAQDGQCGRLGALACLASPAPEAPATPAAPEPASPQTPKVR